MGENNLARRWGATHYPIFGMRVENVGPGVALQIIGSWDFSDDLPTDAVKMESADLPTALVAGGRHDVQIKVKNRELIRRELADQEGDTVSHQSVGRFTVTYSDLWGRRGLASAHIEYASIGLRAALECKQLVMRRPGDQRLDADLRLL